MSADRDDDALAAQERIYASALRHARRVLPLDPALEPADLVQAAWLKIHGRIDTARPECEQAAFWRRAVTQVAIDHYRALKHRHRAPLGLALHAPGDVAREAATAADLDAALATTRRGLAEAVLLGLGYTCTEIGAALGKPVGTVKVNIHWLRRDPLAA